MIFYKNIKKHKKPVEKDIVFSIFSEGVSSNKDDSISKSNDCKGFFNLKLENGILENGLGFEELKLPANTSNLKEEHLVRFSDKMDEIVKIYSVRWFNSSNNTVSYSFLATDIDAKIYGLSIIDTYNGNVWEISSSLQSQPLFASLYRFEGDDYMALFSNEKMVCIGTGASSSHLNVPPFISGIVHYDIFFGILNQDRNKLVYTSNLDLRYWSNSGASQIEFLDDGGAFTKLVLFNDYVYLFREYGITKISKYSQHGDFSFDHLYYSPSKIFENSICVCGENIVFMARDGMYRFDGKNVSKVAEKFDVYFKNLDNTNCYAVCFEGKYYLTTKCDFLDEQQIGCESSTFVNNVLFEVDLKNFNLNVLRGVDVRSLEKIDNVYMSKLCACFFGGDKQKVGQLTCSGDVFGTSTQKEWKSFYTDLGFLDKRKRVKKIIIDTKFDCDVEILSDEGGKIVHFEGKNKQQSQNLVIFGNKFQFKFKTDGKNMRICKPMVIFDVL